MAGTPKFDDFKKRHDGMKTALKKLGGADFGFAWNNLKTFVSQLPGVEAGLAEAIADSQDEGHKGASYKDFLHDKEVKLGMRDFETIYGRLEDAVKEVGDSAAQAAKLGRDLEKLQADLGRAFGKHPTGPDAKKIVDLNKEIEQQLRSLKPVTDSVRKIGEHEKALKEKDKVLAGIVDKAKKLPRKPEKGVPKELKTDKSVADLKKEVDALFKLSKESDGDGLTADELDKKLTRMESIESMLRGALKDCKRTLKQAGHYDYFNKLVNEFQMPRNKLKKIVSAVEKAEDEKEKAEKK